MEPHPQGNKALLIGLFIIVILAALAYWYNAGMVSSGSATQEVVSVPAVTSSPLEVTPTVSPPVQYKAAFDVTKIKVGDKVADMTVVSVGPNKSGAISEHNAKVTFKGEVELGNISLENAAGSAALVCLSPKTGISLADNADLPQLPVSPQPCFDNALAKTEFPPDGTRWLATIMADNWRVTADPDGTYYVVADIVKVVSKVKK